MNYEYFLMTGIPYFHNHGNVTNRFCEKRKVKKLGLKDQYLVRTIQQMLFELGYREVGYIDGIPGPRFFAALTHYQRDHDVEGE